ncbi:MAG TPA: flagellar biosynthesis protein FlhA [Polyangiaceae bacterium]|nr:flagellar biosynthesis protein FlhA [Polyangiaceae bacterium]
MTFSEDRGRGLRAADSALAVLVVAVVALLVVPLPTPLLDVLLATNLAVSVAILLVTLYVGSALELASFPTVLLVTTLVRVALNVSTTRLILLRADAGEVISAFGSFVVGGNFAVGAVVFAILTLVQFVVVAKGSERVAEVGARFSLDALPGKQLAIDAELRAGSLDAEGARRRRRALDRESQFYGAMDGASRFVKGDVVASVLIALVNLIGGVAIGVGQRGLSFGAALRAYGLLTIGDGLVTQIPALLLATAAGLLVTRVESDGPRTALGSELARQLFSAPRALVVASGLVLVLALVPGLPALPFLAIGAALGVAARLGLRAESRRAPGSLEFVPVVDAWALEVSPDVEKALGTLGEPDTALVDRLRARVWSERGVPLPGTRLGVDPELPDGTAVLSIHELPARVVDVKGQGPLETAASLEAAAFALLRSRASDFLGIAETRSLLDALDRRSPETVRAVVPKILDVRALAEVLRRLVEEDVSIRDLGSILEALARAPETERDPLALAEHVRSELRRALTFGLTGGAPELEVVLLDAAIEESIRAAIAKTSAGSFLALAPAAARDVVAAVRRALEEPGTGPAVVLTRPEVRRFVRKLLETDLPDVRVLSFTELLPEIALKTRARATLAGL